MKKQKRVVIITGPGFEEAEVIVPWLYFPAEGIRADLATSSDAPVVGKHGFPIKPTIILSDLSVSKYDAVIIPGGYEAPDRVRQKREAVAFVKDMYQHGKVIASICHGPWVLISAGVLRGKRATCYPGMKDDLVNAGATYIKEPVVVDDNLITADRPVSSGYWVKSTLDIIRAK